MTAMLAKLKLYLAHILSTLAVLLGVGTVAYVSQAPRMGASLPGPCRQIGVSKWQCTTGTDWAVCAADSSVTCLPPAIMPAADASLENIALLADFQATGVTCDGGFPCVGVIRRYMPGMNAGGVFVTPQWSTLDTPISSDLSGPLGAATAVIQYSSGKAAGTMYCPIASVVSCTFDIDYALSYVASSYDGALPPDAGDAGDATDGSDSAPSAPTVTAIALGGTGNDGGYTATSAFAYATDNYGSALTATISGTNFVSGCTGTNPTVNNVACTSPAYVNPTTMTCTLGATTNSANIGVGNVVVTCPAGPGTGTNLFTYLDDPLTCLGPSNVFEWLEPRVNTVSGGNVTAMADLSGNSNTPSTITALAYSAADSNWGNTPSWTCNGTSSTLAFTTVTNPSTTPLLVWAAARMLGSGVAAFFSISGFAWEQHFNGQFVWIGDGVAPTGSFGSTGVLNTSTTWTMYGQSGGVSNATAAFSIGNGTPVPLTGGGTGAPYPANQAFTLCSRPGGASLFMNVSWTSFVMASVQPTNVADAGGYGTADCLETYRHNRGW